MRHEGQIRVVGGIFACYKDVVAFRIQYAA